MRIERIRIEGFGALSGVDLEWPEGSLLLVVDPNETGKTTLCEAIVSALYGLGGRATAARAREIRRPRSGAPLRVGLDVASPGGRWSVDRDLDAGATAIFDRTRGVDETRRFLRGAGKDAFGETLTGLPAALFRTTAYVAQNTLDRGELDASLALELARIADAGGGEASVVRALAALEEARARMRDAATGPAVSVDTEVARLRRRLDERREDMARRDAARGRGRDAGARLAAAAAAEETARRGAALHEIAALAVERDEAGARREALAESVRRVERLEREAADLERGGVISAAARDEIEARRRAIGDLPSRLAGEREALAGVEAVEAEEARATSERGGALAALDAEGRSRLTSLLAGLRAARTERDAAEAALAAARTALAEGGLAEDVNRFERLSEPERAFVGGADEERRSLELAGVALDRKAAAAASAASIAAADRRDRGGKAKGLLVAGVPLLAAGLWLAVGGRAGATGAVLLAFAAGLLLVGGVAAARASGHGVNEEARRRDEEAAARREAASVRKRLSDVRLRLDLLARSVGLDGASSLLALHRRVAAAEGRRRGVSDRVAVLEAVRGRVAGLETEIAAMGGAEALGAIDGLESMRTRLSDLEARAAAASARAAALAARRARLEDDARELEARESALREALRSAGLPEGDLARALEAYEERRVRSTRLAEIRNAELPARREAASEADRDAAAAREEALRTEIGRRLEELGAAPEEIPAAPSAAAARREASRLRREEKARGVERRSAARELAAARREASEGAREAAEALADAESSLERALLYRDALDLARTALAEAASTAYADFRRGLSDASREILASWSVPYQALEFDDALRVSVTVRGGRVVPSREIATSLSTGAREQLHLTARLAALRYLGTGERGVPLLLDDPLTNADDERFLSVMTFLVEHVLTERPVLVVSCHEWRHERWLGSLPPALAARVRRVSLVPNSWSASPATGSTPAPASVDGGVPSI